MAGRIDARLKELGIALPSARAPSANYLPFRISGNLVFISGQVSVAGDEMVKGKVGDNLSQEDGYKGARLCAIAILAQLRNAIGDDIDRARAIKLGGFINATPDFTASPAVMNGASDLMVEVMGDNGKHARFAVAVASLPQGAAVEVDAIFEIE
ncbi:MAG: RidA family protein [Rhodospirillaceae bacterium]